MTEFLVPPDIAPGRVQWGYIDSTAAAPSELTGTVRTSAIAGANLRTARFTWPPQRNFALAGNPARDRLKVLIASLRGQANRAWLAVPGYTPRGSFPASELIANADFSSGASNWSAFSSLERSLRYVYAANASTGAGFGPDAASATTAYAPYCARFLLRSGSASLGSGDVRFGSSSSGSQYSVAVQSALDGMRIAAFVPWTSSVFPGFADYATTRRAGDYFGLHFASLSRCALVDNAPNIATNSNDAAQWGATNCSVGPNGTMGPDGDATSARFLQETGATGQHIMTRSGTVSSAAHDVELAITLAPNVRGWAWLGLTEATGGSACGVYINVSTGAVGSAFGGANWTNVRGFAVPMGAGWIRAYLIARKTNGATSVTRTVGSSTGDGVSSFAGNAGGAAFLWWEETFAASSVPSRVSPTAASAAASGTPQTAAGLHLKGLPASSTGLAVLGDVVQIGRGLYFAQEHLNSDAIGLGYLLLDRPVRPAPADGDPVIFHNPVGRFLLQGGQQSWGESPGLFADYELDFLEDVA